jgi:hypothetical protein
MNANQTQPLCALEMIAIATGQNFSDLKTQWHKSFVCVKCGVMTDKFKKVEHKHIHCLDCYKQVRNEKQKENRKQKREELTCECCGKYDKSVGLATGDNGVEMRVCRYCDVDGSDYNGWGDEDIQKCYNCDEVLDEDMHIFCYRKGDDEMVHCQQCAEDCYEEAKADGWVRDDDNGWGDKEEAEEDNDDEEEVFVCECCDSGLPAVKVHGIFVCKKCDNFEEDSDEEEDYETANCEKCCENFLLEKLETKNDKFYCNVCYEEGKTYIVRCGFYVEDGDGTVMYNGNDFTEAMAVFKEWVDKDYEWVELYDEAEYDEDGPMEVWDKDSHEYEKEKAEENYNCTDENRCEECTHCLRTRPCECGCGLLGGTCIPEEFACETCDAKDIKCLIEYYGIQGERWEVCEECETKFDKEREHMEKCTNCKDIIHEKMSIFCFTRDTEEMTLCENCGGHSSDGIWEKVGWVRDGDEPGYEASDEYMEEDMGECPKCDCVVKRKDLAWRVGYYLDICAKCDGDETSNGEECCDCTKMFSISDCAKEIKSFLVNLLFLPFIVKALSSWSSGSSNCVGSRS